MDAGPIMTHVMGSIDAPAQLEDARKVRTLAEFGDFQLDVGGP